MVGRDEIDHSVRKCAPQPVEDVFSDRRSDLHARAEPGDVGRGIEMQVVHAHLGGATCTHLLELADQRVAFGTGDVHDVRVRAGGEA